MEQCSAMISCTGYRTTQYLPLRGLMLSKESKTSFNHYKFYIIQENNCLRLLLGIFTTLTQERNVSGSKKIGP